MEDVGRCVSELRSRAAEVRVLAAKKLRELVKLQQKELPQEEFNKFLAELNR